MPSQNEITVAKWWDDFWSKGDLSVADEIFDPGFVDHDANTPFVTPDLKGMLEKNVFYRTAFPDLSFTVPLQIVADDYVVCHWVGTGTQQGEFAGLPPSGKPVEFSGISILRLRDGRIVEQTISYDILSPLRQLGATTIPA
jgi:steroid delta-isomerase-like uncharacterized protein